MFHVNTAAASGWIHVSRETLDHQSRNTPGTGGPTRLRVFHVKHRHVGANWWGRVLATHGRLREDDSRRSEGDPDVTTVCEDARACSATRSPRFAVANQKGGVGKTTTTVNLGACFAELGRRVLIIDLDPQANASTGLGLNPRQLDHSLYDVLLQDVPLEDAIEPVSVKNLFVAPASLDLAGAEIELVPAMNRERKLKDAIESVSEDYDIVLIDCPPSLGLLTINGLTAATEVLVPIQTEYYALEGLGQLIRNVDLVTRNLNPTLS